MAHQRDNREVRNSEMNNQTPVERLLSGKSLKEQMEFFMTVARVIAASATQQREQMNRLPQEVEDVFWTSIDACEDLRDALVSAAERQTEMERASEAVDKAIRAHKQIPSWALEILQGTQPHQPTRTGDRQPENRETDNRQPTDRQPENRETDNRQPTDRQPENRETDNRQPGFWNRPVLGLGWPGSNRRI